MVTVEAAGGQDVSEVVADSKEEADALIRSRKKVDHKSEGNQGGRPLVIRHEDWMNDDPISPTKENKSSQATIKSYKDACMNKDECLMEEEEENDGWWYDEGWKSCISVDTTGKVPNVVLSEEFRAKMARRWRRSLIVSVLGMTVREEIMAKKLMQLWGDVDTIDIGSGFFLVNCKRESIYEMALSGGPWLIFYHYISVQPWRSDFHSEGENVSHIAAWVRIARLSLDYYDRGVLYVLGSQIGEVLRVDKNTLNRSKGRFARVCVKLDLSKPLLPSIKVNGVEKKIEYEGLHLICFKCGKYGHDTERCNLTAEGVDCSGMVIGENQDATAENEKDEAAFGGWMVVQRNWRPKVLGRQDRKGRDLRGDGGGNRAYNMGSRFSALNTENNLDSFEIGESSINDVPANDVFNGQLMGGKSFNRSQKKELKINKSVGQKKSINVVPSPMEAYLAVKSKMGHLESNSLNMEQDVVDLKLKKVSEMQLKEHAKTLKQVSTTNDLRKGMDTPMDPGG